VVRYDPTTGARPVGQAEAEQVLGGYLRRYRLGAPAVNAFLGWLAGRPFDASPADVPSVPGDAHARRPSGSGLSPFIDGSGRVLLPDDRGQAEVEDRTVLLRSGCLDQLVCREDSRADLDRCRLDQRIAGHP
jgi:hypothetical protein